MSQKCLLQEEHTQAKNRSVDIASIELLDELGTMLSQPTEEIRNDLGSIRRLERQVLKRGLDALGKVALADTESDRLLLAGLGQIRLERRAQEVGQDALGDVVHLLERCLRALERREADKLHGLAELGEVLRCGLHLCETVADCVRLEDDFEDLCTVR